MFKRWLAQCIAASPPEQYGWPWGCVLPATAHEVLLQLLGDPGVITSAPGLAQQKPPARATGRCGMFLGCDPETWTSGQPLTHVCVQLVQLPRATSSACKWQEQAQCVCWACMPPYAMLKDASLASAVYSRMYLLLCRNAGRSIARISMHSTLRQVPHWIYSRPQVTTLVPRAAGWSSVMCLQCVMHSLTCEIFL
jgi:hypothetical protein